MNYPMNNEIAFVQRQLSAVWPNWHISKRLGKGSYGSVYEIVRDDLGTRYTCALKVLYMETLHSDASETQYIDIPGKTVYSGNKIETIRQDQDTDIGQSRDQVNGFAPSAPRNDSPAKGADSSSAEARIAQRTVWSSVPLSSDDPVSPPELLVSDVSNTEIEEFVRSVSSEIDLMMQLKGVPNIVTIEDYAILRDPNRCTILIRMEELEPLDNFLRRCGGLLQKNLIVRLGADICSALIFCEQKNILHRDIKTSNLFYSKEAGFKLGDFGISRTMASIREKASMSGIGTLRYMAPEIYQGKKYNNTADIYSLGIVLYILTNGLLPPLYEKTSPENAGALSSEELHKANMRRLLGEALPPPRYADDYLASVICTACSPLPENRFQTAAAFRNALLGSLQREQSLQRQFNDPGNHGQMPAAGPVPGSPVSADPIPGSPRSGSFMSAGRYNSPKAEKSGEKSNLRLLPLICVLLAAAGIVLFIAARSIIGGNDSGSPSEASAPLQETETVQETGTDSDPASGKDNTDLTGSESASGADNISGDGSETASETNNLQGSDSGSIPETTDMTDSESASGTDPSGAAGTASGDTQDIGTVVSTPEETNPNTVIKWSDQNLQTAVMPQVQKELGITGDLTIGNAGKVQKLNLENAGISDLSSLRYFTGLNELNLSNNYVEDVSPLAGLQKLKDLDLSKNMISDAAPLSDLVRLNRLDLYMNNISDISGFSGLTQLTVLDLRSNNVRDISALKNMELMKELYLSNTLIDDLSSLSGMAELTYLGLKNTNISNIAPVKKNIKLERLVLGGTKVRDISIIDDFPDLKYLDISGCPISNKDPAHRMEKRDGAQVVW